MKKKARRYDEGGDIKQRAKFFAALADNPEQQASFQREIHEAQQREAEASDRKRAANTPAPKPSAAIVKAASRPVAEGTFTDSDEADRAERRARDEAENMARIEAAKDFQTADVAVPSTAQTAAPTVKPSTPSTTARVGRAGQARTTSTPTAEPSEPRRAYGVLGGGEQERANEARIEARRRAEAEDRQRREEAAAARATGAQRSANIAEGRRSQEAAEAADARAAAAKAPGLGRAMMRRPASESTSIPASTPSRRFMAARVRRRVERPSGTESFAKGGSVSAASKRGDGIAKRGKTRGRLV